MKNKYIIYKYTFPDGGVYIGQTCQKLKYRQGKDGKNYLTVDKQTGEFLQPEIAHAIIKYGWDNVKKEIILENLSSEEADQNEISLISQYRAGGKCYNMASGGKGTCGTRSTKILQYDLSGKLIKKWESIKEAETEINKPRAQANIVACCQGRKHRAYGYIWRYANDPNKLEVKPLTPYRSPINQITKTGKIINTYPTIAEASRCTGIGSTSIGNALRGWSSSAGGYVWKFV